MKKLFIVNPAAGKGKPLKAIPFIKKKKDFHGSEIVKTEYTYHGEEIAREASSNGWEAVFSVGGDGTINEIVNGIAGSGVALGIIPCGSGNDFIRTLDKNYKKKVHFKALLERHISKKTKSIDLGRINDRYFVNISSAGFDAASLINRNKIKKIPFIPGWLAYYLSVFYTLVKCRKYKFEISIDNETFLKNKFLLVAVSNGKYYGGGMTPTPEADISDGFLDLCVIESMSRIKILFFFAKFIKGRHAGIKGVSFYRGKHIEVKSSHVFPLNIDGEVSLSNHAIFDIEPNALNVIIP